MNHDLPHNVIVERAFWVASATAVVGAVAPLVAAIGHTNRLAPVFFPFAIAALAMGALALFYQQGKTIAALVYFVAGLAIAYGMLLLLSVPMRLAVLGSCPPAPQRCASGLELQLSPAEGTGLTIAVAFGLLSLFAGFVGLAALYRQRAPAPPPPVWPDRPPPQPERQAAPAPALEAVPAAAPEPEPQPEPVAAPASEPRRKRKRAPAAPVERPPEPPSG